jgi:sarcosine oxidase subunit alpha
VTPIDVGLEWAIGKAKPDFVGKRSLAREVTRSPDRKQLVGLLSGTVELEEGAQVVDLADPGRSIGHVTSSYASATLGHPIAMALVRGGRARMGERLGVASAGKPIVVTVVDPVFYDPGGDRLHG